MNKLSVNAITSPSQRFMKFSKEQKDIVTAGVELYKHYLYLNKGQEKYAEFAKGMGFEEKQNLFSDNLIKEAFNQLGMPYSDSATVRSLPFVQQMAFALVSETQAVIIPSTVLDNMHQFAEVRNGGWGDNFRFTVQNPGLFTVSKIANGIRSGAPQRLFNSEVTLTPVGHEITIEEDFYRVLAGQVNFGDWVTRVAQSVETQIATDVYTAFYNAYGSIGTSFKEAAFDSTAYAQLGQRVQAANRGARVAVFGTRVALSKVIPNANFTNFGVGVGEEYIRTGYISGYAGFDHYVLDQRIKPNDPNYTFAIADDQIYFVALGTDKPIKVAFEGTPVIYQSQMGDKADNTLTYNYQQKWDTALITSAKFGVMRVG